MNEYRFYGKTDPTSGDSDYDHIVPIFGIESESADKTTYYPNDQLIFSDNGLWNSHGHIDNFVFQYGFDAIQKSRVQANARTGSIYSLNNNGTNYGISISGVLISMDQQFQLDALQVLIESFLKCKKGQQTSLLQAH